MFRIILLIALVGLTLRVGLAALIDQAEPAFEVASVKPTQSTTPQMVIRTPPSGGMIASDVTPKFLIRYAFALEDFLIFGAPDWSTSAQFNVTATGPPHASLDATRSMLRVLLRERFRLRTHLETRDMPIYALVTARRDKRLGQNLRRTRAECTARVPPARRSPVPKVLPAITEALPCGLRVAFGHISGGALTMAELGQALASATNRRVLDKTALADRFDVVLNFAPEHVRLQADPPGPDASSAQSAVPAWDGSVPSVFTAVQDQLGLKLQPRSDRVEVLVIDGIDHPTPD